MEEVTGAIAQSSHHASDKSACLQDKLHFIDLVPVDSCESWYACLQGKLYLIDLVLVDGWESWYLEVAAAQRNFERQHDILNAYVDGPPPPTTEINDGTPDQSLNMPASPGLLVESNFITVVIVPCPLLLAAC